MTREEDTENRVLFSFMKDNIAWKTKYDENKQECKFYNPINASYLGLQFHESEIWLNAVVDKFQDYVTKHKINMSLLVAEVIEDHSYCFKVYFSDTEDSEPYVLYHFHSKDFKKGLRKVLVQLIHDLTFKYN